jgi:hypothetical protein
LNLNSSIFGNMRADFDTSIRKLVDKITEKGIDAGTINIKIDLNLQDNSSEDEPNVAAYIPVITYKIQSQFTEKSTANGSSGGADVQLYTEGDGWHIRNDPHGQMSLDLT